MTNDFNFLAVLLVQFGLAYVAGHSLITVGLRRWLFARVPRLVDLLECPACFGFWAGIVMGICRGAPSVTYAFASGLMISGSNLLLFSLYHFLSGGTFSHPLNELKGALDDQD